MMVPVTQTHFHVHCNDCGSTEIAFNATVGWNESEQTWDVWDEENPCCMDCESDDIHTAYLEKQA